MLEALLLERDRDARKVVHRRLRRRGYGVTDDRQRTDRPSLVIASVEEFEGAGWPGIAGGTPPPWVIVLSDTDTVDVAIRALRRGAIDVVTKPIDADRFDEALTKVHSLVRAHSEVGDLRDQLRSLGRFGRIVGRSDEMQAVYDLIAKVAPTDTTIFVLGETGTGKEVVARTIHDQSERSDGPFVPVNCGAIAPNLIESELFGHEKGAFTGASERRRGLFEMARGGTLFLDEITEMPTELQVNLLRVLETGQVRRVGGRRAVTVDVRIIAATNREPDAAVREGELREDLLYRIMVFPVTVPPLRERRDDVALLAEHFLGELNRELRKKLRFTSEALQALSRYDWPGNVRELRNVLERACILARDRIRAGDLPLGEGPLVQESEPAAPVPVGKSLREMEKELILATLDHFDGSRKRAAETLGICPKTLYNRLRSYRSASEDA